MRETFDIQGMTCAACSARVQRAASDVPGVTEANVNLLKNSMELDFDGTDATAAAVVAAISPAGPEVEVIARQIANAHTLFNVTMTVLWLPLVSVMVKIVMAILPEKPRRPRDSLADTLETPLAPDAAAA